jgi:putative ABC transport system ATP-binding protein
MSAVTADVAMTVHARDLSKTYGTGHAVVQAVREATFDISARDFIALVGPSGAGKTTLLAMLGGLLTPTSGHIVVSSVDLTKLNADGLARFRREQVGFVFQGYNLLPYLTARKNLMAIAQIAGLDRSIARDRAERLLDELGLAERADAYPAELSGGERQRVAIGRALMNDPALILVDEPTANLDTARGKQVVQMLVSEVLQRSKAALMVTHDPRMAEYATRQLRIEDGVVMEP